MVYGYLFIKYSQCWWLGHTKNEGISSHDINLVIPEYSSFSTRWVKINNHINEQLMFRRGERVRGTLTRTLIGKLTIVQYAMTFFSCSISMACIWCSKEINSSMGNYLWYVIHWTPYKCHRINEIWDTEKNIQQKLVLMEIRDSWHARDINNPKWHANDEIEE